MKCTSDIWNFCKPKFWYFLCLICIQFPSISFMLMFSLVLFRGCTDIVCCVLFGLYMTGMIIIGVIGMYFATLAFTGGIWRGVLFFSIVKCLVMEIEFCYKIIRIVYWSCLFLCSSFKRPLWILMNNWKSHSFFIDKILLIEVDIICMPFPFINVGWIASIWVL